MQESSAQPEKEITSNMVDSNVKEHESVDQLNEEGVGDCNGAANILAASLSSSPSSSATSNNNKNKNKNKPSSQEDMVATIGNVSVQWKVLRGGSSNESSLVSLTRSNDSGDRYSVSDSEVDFLEERLNSFHWNDDIDEERIETESLLSDKNISGVTCISSVEHKKGDTVDVGRTRSHESNTSSIEDAALGSMDRYDFHVNVDEHKDREDEIVDVHNDKVRSPDEEKDTNSALISRIYEDSTNLPTDRYSIEVQAVEDELQDSNDDGSEGQLDTTRNDENPVHYNQNEAGKESQSITNDNVDITGEQTNDDLKDTEMKVGNEDLIEPSNKSTTAGKANEHEQIETGETSKNDLKNPLDETNVPGITDTDVEDDDGSESSDDTLGNKSGQ